jgi:glucose/arabinose dehydrogenase
MKPTRKLLVLSVLAAFGAQAQQPQISAANNPEKVDVQQYLSKLVVPEGFKVSVYASGMEEARSLALGDDGTLYVGTRGAQGAPAIGKVYAIPNRNGDGQGDEIVTILEGLNYPNGVAFHDGDLYVAELNRVLKYENVSADTLKSMPEPVVVVDGLPNDYMHGWKFIDIGPDNKLYIPVGANCNTCEVEGYHGTILRANLDGSDLEVYAKGVRNTVGFAWEPTTGGFWFTDNGRDLWGDDIPPEELNNVTQPGQNFGFPYRFGKDLVDKDYTTTLTDSDFVPPVLEMPAHNAGLGVEFYTGSQFPAEYKNQLFATYHGSWNRNPIDGYKVRLMRFENGKAVSYEDFLSGWMEDNKYWGRPVDIEQMADGSLLVSDDFNGVVYRVSYGE